MKQMAYLARPEWKDRMNVNIHLYVGYTFLYTGALLFFLTPFFGFQGGDGLSFPVLLAFLFSSIASFYYGKKTLERQNKRILFLRRFGVKRSGKVLTYALRKALDSRWRVITLDDSKLMPVGIREVSVLTRTLFKVLVVNSISILFLLYYAQAVRDAVFYSVESIPNDADIGVYFYLIKDGFKAIVNNVIQLIIIKFLASLILFISVFFLFSLLTWEVYTWWQVIAANKNRFFQIPNAGILQKTLARMFNKSRKLFSARLFVLRVEVDFWQDAVQTCIQRSDIVLVDITRLSDAIIWEIQTIIKDNRVHLIPIGQKEVVEHLFNAPNAGLTTNEATMKELLNEAEIFVYEIKNKMSLQDFSNLLKAKLELLLLPDALLSPNATWNRNWVKVSARYVNIATLVFMGSLLLFFLKNTTIQLVALAILFPSSIVAAVFFVLWCLALFYSKQDSIAT